MRHGPGIEARRTRRVLVATIATLLLAAGCKGGGSSGNDVIPCTNLSFTPALLSPANGDVYLQGITSNCNSVDVSVSIANLSGIFTVSFDLAYPPALVSYQSYIEGPVILQGSPANTPVFVVNSASSGSLQVTMSRLLPDDGVAVTGIGSLIIVRFSRVAKGSGTIDFDSSLGSTVSETIYDKNHNVLAASFGPGHGGTVLVP